MNYFPLIKELLRSQPGAAEVSVPGWVRTKRESKNIVFLELNDGSSLTGLQCVYERGGGENALDRTLSKVTTGAAVRVTGLLSPSPAAGQAVELKVSSLVLLGEADAASYPLQKKRHSLEFLREIPHLRPRANTFAAAARLRSRLAFAVHQFFQERNFQYIATPILTSSDAEGAGAQFQVTTLDLAELAKSGKAPDYNRDFFGKKTYLTVSGQLEAETYALALSRVYTFGPTFRAENSNTTRHLAEFWMVEPEAAFFELEDNIALACDFLKTLLKDALTNCAEDIAFFDKRIAPGQLELLQKTAESPFTQMTYTEAVNELVKAQKHFEFAPKWGEDLQSEHERFLTETAADGPVVVTDYPKQIKAFYMKLNADGKTVRAMDVLFPRLGEIIGGSQREERLGLLLERMKENAMNAENYTSYLDLRRFGSAPHSGFGLGFERLVQFVTGLTNIRDVIPYPRTAGSAKTA